MRLPKNFDHPRIVLFYKFFKSLRRHDSAGIFAGNQMFIRLERNVLSGEYVHHCWRFIRAMNRMFDEIIQGSRKGLKVYRVANELKDWFSSQMDVYMEEQGYCCGRWYRQAARTVGCVGEKSCEVLPNSVYYRFESYTFCRKCFAKFQGDSFPFNGLTLDKRQFLEFFFEAEENEKFTRCSECKRRFHEKCVLYCRLSNVVFTCKICQEKKKIKPSPSIRASMIPATSCDLYINDFLKSQGMNIDNRLTIRLVSNVAKTLSVDELILGFHKDTNQYPYQNCSLFTFFDTGNDSDICFFSIFFQIYGADCPEPNRNSSYISYMDSVNLLPSKERTKIYRLILLGLFKFLSVNGSTKIFLWSCPPKQRNDYIFYNKPIHMKIPNRQRLSQWYQDMLKMGLQLKVIEKFHGIHSYAKHEEWTGISDIPYFEGDLWIVRMTEAIKSVEKESARINREILKVFKKLEAEWSSVKKLQLTDKLRSLTLQQQEFDELEKIWDLVKVQLEGYESEYFVINMAAPTSTNQHSQPMETNVSKSTWLSDRHLFLDFFWSQMLEFSCEREAQYSTFIMIHRILAENRICIQCNTTAEGREGDLKCRRCCLAAVKQQDGFDGQPDFHLFLQLRANDNFDLKPDVNLVLEPPTNDNFDFEPGHQISPLKVAPTLKSSPASTRDSGCWQSLQSSDSVGSVIESEDGDDSAQEMSAVSSSESLEEVKELDNDPLGDEDNNEPEIFEIFDSEEESFEGILGNFEGSDFTMDVRPLTCLRPSNEIVDTIDIDEDD